MKGKKIFLSYKYGLIDSYFVRDIIEQFEFLVFEVVAPDILTITDSIAEGIQSLIRSADIFVVFFTSGSSNLLFELGYAMGLGKKIVVVSEPNTPLAVDIANLFVIKGNFNSLDVLPRLVQYIEKLQLPTLSKNLVFDSSTDLLNSYKASPNIFDEIHPKDFEDAVFNWFLENGFRAIRTASYNDAGCDFLISNYKNCRRAIVEVKKLSRNSKTPISTVRQLIGSVYSSEADCGILITSSEFTSAAIEMAKKQQKPIELWTMDDLLDKKYVK
jgi:HJR/Mrr/RecB family endonuclease